MRLALLTALTMLAFAANSILNRAAVGAGHIEASDFALIRVIAGAVTLAALAILGKRQLALLLPSRLWGAVTLSLYLIGFSVAYLSLDAGLGALILFGGVQVTMFAGAALAGDALPARRWIGSGLAFAGLVWLLWPTGAVAVPIAAGLAMCVAALGWGLYSLAGRGSKDPLADTAANFLLAVPLCALTVLVMPEAAQTAPITLTGLILAVTSGAVTSGLGYALWYQLLPKLDASVAGLVQLCVPVIAVLGGIVLLSEPPSLRLIGAGVLVLGGIAYGLGAFQRRIGSSGS